MATKGDRVFVAIESGSADIKGQVYTFTKGVTRVREGHELLKVYGAYFEPADQNVHYDVEQTTAAPGEKRTTKRRTKRSTKATAASSEK